MELQSELEQAARKIRDFGSTVPFGKVDAKKDAELAEKFVPEGHYPQLLWFVHGEPTSYHRSLRKSASIVDFVLALDRDPMATVSSEEEVRNFNRAVFAQLPRSSPHFKALEVVAAKHMDTVAFAFKEAEGENITWVSDSSQSIGYEGEITQPKFERWLRSRLVKSEPPPSSGSKYGGSRVVVGQTFEDMVLRPDEDVFLLIYASWCGYSRKFMPIWEEFAIRTASVPHLMVMKMDGDQNGSPIHETFSWTSYPKVFFLKAGTETPTEFHGNRTVENLAEFANEHGSQRFELDGSFDPDSLAKVLSGEDEAEL